MHIPTYYIHGLMHMKRQSTPFIMLILRTNANQNYFKIPVFISQTGSIKNLTIYSYDMAVEKPALTCMAGGNADGTAPAEGIRQYLKPHIYLPFVPEIPLLGIYLEDISPSIQK